MEISDSLSRRIVNMGVIVTLFVVFAHYGWHVTNKFESICYSFVQLLWRLPVPAFFVVSGFFLARRADEDGWWKRECVKRVRSLLVPYFIWSLIGVLAIALITIVANACAGKDLLFGVRWHGMQLVQDLGLHPWRLLYIAPLWYLRALFVLVLISPIIRRYNGVWWLIGVFAVYGLVSPRGENLNSFQSFFRLSLSLEGLFYFSVGDYLYSHKVSIPFRRSMVGLALGMLGLIVFVYLHRRCSSVHVYLIRWASIPLVLQGLWHLVPDWRFPKVLVKGTFPAYLVHMIVIRVLQRFGVMQYCCVDLISSALTGISIWLVSATVLPLMMRRWLPRFSAVAFGGRG